MSTPPPLPPASDWDVPSIRIAALVLAAGNAAFWIYAAKAIRARGYGVALGLVLGATR
jgi:hypothetical protein